MAFDGGDRSKARKYAILILCHPDLADQFRNPYSKTSEDIDEEDDSDEEEDSEEDSEESEESEEESEGEDKPELSRQERRDLKKKEAAAKAKKKEEGDEEEDPDLINPNHVQKKLKISDLNAPTELSRRERCVFQPSQVHVCDLMNKM
jgi:cobalamin biosynthesis protein CobT